MSSSVPWAPSKRTVLPSGALTAGDSFLSAHANLADGLIPTVAMKRSSLAEVERLDARWISEPAEMVRAEEWSYEPCLLGDGRDADPLSVILTFGNTEDERIQGAIDRVLDEVFA